MRLYNLILEKGGVRKDVHIITLKKDNLPSGEKTYVYLKETKHSRIHPTRQRRRKNLRNRYVGAARQGYSQIRPRPHINNRRRRWRNMRKHLHQNKRYYNLNKVVGHDLMRS